MSAKSFLPSRSAVTIYLLLAFCATLGAATAALPAISNLTELEPGLLSAGQPSEDQLRELAQAGYKTVVDLRPAQESRGFDEAKVTGEAGLTYVNVPVALPTLDAATVDRFLAALRTAERPALLHCASGNRVAGLYYAWLVLEKGVAPEEAIQKARTAGLRSPDLEEKIVLLVQQRKTVK